MLHQRRSKKDLLLSISDSDAHYRSGAFRRYVSVLNVVLRYNNVPDSATFKQLIRKKDWRGLYTLADELSQRKYATAGEHFAGNQFAAIVKKYPWDPKHTGHDPESVALLSFQKSERKCKRMNQKFKLYRTLRDPDSALLCRARDWIQYVLGTAVPSYYDDCDFGSGASVGVHGKYTHLGRKLQTEMTVTPAATGRAMEALWGHHQYRDTFLEQRVYAVGDNDVLAIACVDGENFAKRARSSFSYIGYNKICFVPKTAKTHRAIAVEPTLNGLLQKGIDQVMRRRLKRVGIDLSDQSMNQRMAWKGSLNIGDPYSTIDLSSASDSISIELVRYLLPEAWFAELSALRASQYMLPDGSVSIYEKFCSMGNGFCFPLESLIFASLCHAAGATDFAVYGDDIIVRRSTYDLVLRLLKTCGFTPNVSKTFGDGPFRESCGADWYDGNNVRPFTMDFALDSVRNIHKFLNLSRRNARSEMFFREANQMLINGIPDELFLPRPFFSEEVEGGINPSDLYSEPIWKDRDVSAMWNFSHGVYSWLELSVKAVVDRKGQRSAPSWVRYAAALRGATPQAMFVARKLTTVTASVKRGGGAVANYAIVPSYLGRNALWVSTPDPLLFV